MRKMINDITFCITYYRRPFELAKLVRSIGLYYPAARIDVQDTGGNLSWGRNQLVQRCQTPLFFMLEEDMRFNDRTSVPTMFRLLKRSPDHVAGIGGGVIEKGRIRYKAANFLELEPGVQELVSSKELTMKGRVIECDAITNWGLFRLEALKETRWDEKLELAEHEDFFWRLTQVHGWKVGCSIYQIGHTSARPSMSYRMQRKRLAHFRALANRKMKFVGRPSRHPWRACMTKREYARWRRRVYGPLVRLSASGKR